MTIDILGMSATSRWVVEHYQRVRLPKCFEVVNLAELRSRLQAYADSYLPSDENPALGELIFDYELDDKDRVNLIRVRYVNKHGKRARFARLRRDP